MDQCLSDSTFVHCVNRHQSPIYICDKITPTIGPIFPTVGPIIPTFAPASDPVQENGSNRNLVSLFNYCRDYRVKYCCGKPKPKCYCCPPRLPENKCRDNGCQWMSNDNSTECVDVTNPDWKELNYKYDLSAKNVRKNRLCGSTVDDSCCKCMKRKTCKDTGCKKRFEGKGICVDAIEGDLSKHDIDFDVKPDQTPGLCTNDVNDNCCTCFKKQDTASDCYKMRCSVGKVDGICIGPNDPSPNGFKRTDQRCDEKGDCRCYIPCKDTWSASKCKKNARKGKCKEAATAEKCCETCLDY